MMTVTRTDTSDGIEWSVLVAGQHINALALEPGDIIGPALNAPGPIPVPEPFRGGVAEPHITGRWAINKAAECDRLWAEGTRAGRDAVFNQLGSSAKLQWLVNHHADMPPEETVERFVRIWHQTNLLFGQPLMTDQQVRDTFAYTTHVRPLTDNPEFHASITPGTLLWHGSDSHNQTGDNYDRFCWTTDQDVGLLFHRRYGGGLWVGTVTADTTVYGSFTGAGEAEVLVEPDTLDRVEQVI